MVLLPSPQPSRVSQVLPRSAQASTGLHKLRQPLLDGDEHTERQAAAALTLPQPSLSASRVDLDPEAPGSPTLAEEKHATRREMIGLAFNALVRHPAGSTVVCGPAGMPPLPAAPAAATPGPHLLPRCHAPARSPPSLAPA